MDHFVNTPKENGQRQHPSAHTPTGPDDQGSPTHRAVLSFGIFCVLWLMLISDGSVGLIGTLVLALILVYAGYNIYQALTSRPKLNKGSAIFAAVITVVLGIVGFVCLIFFIAIMGGDFFVS